MASKTVRQVNVVPFPKIKQEVLTDDDEDVFMCRLCNKSFVTEMAVNNHAKIEHINAYLNGEDFCVTHDKKPAKRKLTEEQRKEIQLKTDKLLSSMRPTRLSALASSNASYMIIRDEEALKKLEAKDYAKKKIKMDKDKTPVKKEKETKPITGPFECLQPSTLIPDGKCHQMFFSCCEYSTHFRDEHTRRGKGHKCQVCEKPLNGVDQSPFTCQMCSTVFPSSKLLSEHCSTVHSKLKPYQCSVCSKRFTQQGGLQQHMRGHTGDRPFACTYCPKAFTQKSGLDQHLRIHTKFKPYRCVICEKTFCQSVHLQQHMRTHTNVAPFQCIICQKRFKQSSHLNYHIKYHNPANLTDEQKLKYMELLAVIGRQELVEVEVDPNNDVVIDTNVDPIQELVVGDHSLMNEYIDTQNDMLHESVMVVVDNGQQL